MMRRVQAQMTGRRDMSMLRKWNTFVFLVLIILFQLGTAIAQGGIMDRPERYTIEGDGILVEMRLEDDRYIYLFVDANTDQISSKGYIKCRNYQNKLIWQTALEYEGVVYHPTGLLYRVSDDAYLVSCLGNSMEETMLMVSNHGEIIGNLPLLPDYFYPLELPESFLWQTDASKDVPPQIMLTDKQGQLINTYPADEYPWFNFKRCVVRQDGSMIALGYKIVDGLPYGAVLHLDESFSVKWSYVYLIYSALIDVQVLPNDQIVVVGMQPKVTDSGLRSGVVLWLDAEGEPISGFPLIVDECPEFVDVRVDDRGVKAYGCNDGCSFIYTIGEDGSIKANEIKVIYNKDEGSRLLFTFNRQGEAYLFGGLRRNSSGTFDNNFLAPYMELNSLSLN